MFAQTAPFLEPFQIRNGGGCKFRWRYVQRLKTGELTTHHIIHFKQFHLIHGEHGSSGHEIHEKSHGFHKALWQRHNQQGPFGNLRNLRNNFSQ